MVGAAQRSYIHDDTRESFVSAHAAGTFEVSVKPVSAAEEADGNSLGRMSLDKQFDGDLSPSAKAKC